MKICRIASLAKHDPLGKSPLTSPSPHLHRHVEAGGVTVTEDDAQLSGKTAACNSSTGGMCVCAVSCVLVDLISVDPVERIYFT